MKAAIVTGNGPSMKEIDYSLLPKDYDVFRCNEFYHEREYFIGKKIKAVFFRIDDFFEQYYMMYKLIQNGDYECENIAFKKYNFQDRKEEIFSKNYKYFFPAAIDAYDKYFSKLKKLSDYIDFNICYNFERKEMLTGTYAICCAVACGYKEIYLAGMDLFENKNQDVYFYGKGYGIIESIHNKNKDLEIINFLQDNYDIQIFSICPTSPINNYIPLAKKQNEQEFKIQKKPNGAILKKLLPSKKAKLRYKKIYLTSNSFIHFIYDVLRTPRAIKRYLKDKYQR